MTGTVSMQNPPHKSKRRRSAADDDQAVRGAARSIVRHPDLWFPDGNIIVVSEEGMSFKAHSGVLERHSVVLKEILALNHEEDVGEQCKLIRLSDKGEDLALLFSIMYGAGQK